MLIVIIVAMSLLSCVAIVVLAYLFVPSPAGPPIATADVRSGEPFELRYESTGASQRVFLDMACDPCSLPVDGQLEIEAGSEPVKTVEISAGSRQQWQRNNQLDAHFLTEVPASDPGVVVTVRGRLTVPPNRGVFAGEPLPDGPLADVSELRVSIAP